MVLSKASIVKVAKSHKLWLDNLYLEGECTAAFHQACVRSLRAWMRGEFALATR